MWGAVQPVEGGGGFAHGDLSQKMRWKHVNPVFDRLPGKVLNDCAADSMGSSNFLLFLGKKLLFYDN
jgi:hypothetical protein